MSRPIRSSVRPSTTPHDASGSAPVLLGRARRPSVRRAARAAAVAGVLAASCGLATAAHAADPSVDRIVEPLAAQAGPDRLADPGTLAATAAGNGHVAWVVVRGVTLTGAADAQNPVAEVWTRRGADAVKVADVPLAGVLRDVELGDDAAGDPVLVVASWGPDNTTEFRLVGLGGGAVRKVSSTRRGLTVGGMAIDAGTLLYVVHPEKMGPRNTSSLWRAPLAGTSIGRATKVRTSVRREMWAGVHADVHRVAVSTVRAPEKGTPSSFFARDELAFGTLRGPWTRTGVTYATDGGYRPVTVLGFSHDGRAVITAQDQQRGAPLALRVPMGKGPVKRLRLGGSAETGFQAPSYDAAIDRILAFGPDMGGRPSVGWTGIVLR